MDEFVIFFVSIIRGGEFDNINCCLTDESSVGDWCLFIFRVWWIIRGKWSGGVETVIESITISGDLLCITNVWVYVGGSAPGSGGGGGGGGGNRRICKSVLVNASEFSKYWT